MRSLSSFFIFLLLFTIHSCQPETIGEAKKLSVERDFKLIAKKNYSIKVLNYMNSTTILNIDASLQYMNANKEEYIIVIEEPKADFIAALKKVEAGSKENQILLNYRNAQFQYTEQKMEVVNRSSFRKVAINGLKVEAIEIDAKLKELEELVSYYFYYIEGEEQLFTIMAWTLASKKAIYREKVKKMVRTFNTKD
jgi:hypothetical protein